MKDKLKFIFFVFLGAFCLLVDAFYNGFPIVYSDTSTYIASGFSLEPPFDRPITYGLFLRLFSLNGLSLWGVVFFQSLILSYLIFLLVRLVTDNKSFLKFGLLTIILLSVFTSVSWTCSQLMPDIFTSITLLSLILILFGTFEQRTSILLYSLFFISVAMHMSHILMFGLLLVIVFGLRKYLLPRQNYPKRSLNIAILLLLTISSIVTMGSAFSKSKHVFFMGAMVEHGILKNYLDEYCDTKPYKLCAYKDSLPDKAYIFVWDEKSPINKIGGWKATKNEFQEIIYGTLTQPKYILMHIKESLKATLQQFRLFSIGDGNGSFLEGTLLQQRVSKYYPNDLLAYTSSKQNQSKLYSLDFLNSLFAIVVVFSLLTLVFLWFKFASALDGKIKIIVLIFFIGILLNAWDCGTFANAIDRLGSKMIWLIPFMTILLACKILYAKQKQELNYSRL